MTGLHLVCLVIGVSFNLLRNQGEKFMSTALIEQISSLSDTDSVEFLEHFNQVLANGVTNDFDDLLATIPPSIYELPEFNSIKDLALGETERKLTEQESIELAKPILGIVGQNSDFLPLLEQAWKTWEQHKKDLEDELGDGGPSKILSAALAASMVITVAATEVKGNIGGVEIYKPIVSVKDVAEMVGQFGKIILGSK
jgi:hypothetical protein